MWHKYKEFSFTTIKHLDFEVRIVINNESNKTFFCFDDLLQFAGYKLSDGSLTSSVLRRYTDKFRFVTFIELFPKTVFIPMESIKNIPVAVMRIRNANSATAAREALISVINKYSISAKTRKDVEVEINELMETFYTIGKHNNVSISTYNNKPVVKYSDIARYCGYKDTDIHDIYKEHAIKLKTKFGPANFVYLDSFHLIADRIQPNYSVKLTRLYNHIIKLIPTLSQKDFIMKKESNLFIYDNMTFSFVADDGFKVKSKDIQNFCGYSNDKLNENFQNLSEKIQGTYYIPVNAIKTLLSSKMGDSFKKPLRELFNHLHRFSEA